MSSKTLVLPFGRFYGQLKTRDHTGGIESAIFNADPNRIVERHTHEEAHFVLVLEGLYRSTANGAEAVSRGPLLVFNPAGTTHRDRFEAESRTLAGRFLTISISSALMGEAARGRSTPRCATVLRDPQALGLAHALAAVAADGRGVSTIERESIGYSLIDSALDTDAPQSVDAPSWLRLATDLLRDSSGDDLCISDVAAAAGVHPTHLARVFRHFMHCSPGVFLRRCRMQRAAALLRYTRRPLSDIAATCGFADQSHFTTAFRREHGQTPAAWRRASVG